MADSTLNAIQLKVRRLTRSPSANQLSDADINQYINTFVQYDMPESIRLKNLHTTFTFFTEPFIDTYQTNQIPGDQFFNWDNQFITIDEPIFIAGYRAFFTQDRDQFFAIYPLVNYQFQIGVGDGITTQFQGVLNIFNGGPGTQTPILRNNVTINSIDANNNGMVMQDNGVGALIGVPGAAGGGVIDYVTGAYNILWAVPPGPGEAVNAMTVPYQPTRPTAFLFYDGQITLRPVPDQGYRVQMQSYVRPTELLAANQSPDLEEWWQYIAYGAALKVFQDRMDTASEQQIMPEFKKQETLVLRRTIVQQAPQRVATIYTEQTSLGAYGSGGGWGGPF